MREREYICMGQVFRGCHPQILVKSCTQPVLNVLYSERGSLRRSLGGPTVAGLVSLQEEEMRTDTLRG